MEWLDRTIARVRSVRIARSAVAHQTRAESLRSVGQEAAALATARAGLLLLKNPAVARQEPPEATAIFGLTTLVEELAGQLAQPGADIQDIRDALSFMKRLDGVGVSPVVAGVRAKWIPYLETRLRAAPEDTN